MKKILVFLLAGVLAFQMLDSDMDSIGQKIDSQRPAGVGVVEFYESHLNEEDYHSFCQYWTAFNYTHKIGLVSDEEWKELYARFDQRDRTAFPEAIKGELGRLKELKK